LEDGEKAKKVLKFLNDSGWDKERFVRDDEEKGLCVVFPNGKQG
jgi:hypothetical protein